MDLQDIRHAVASFLSNSDLAAAALVCRSWNASFIPFLYSNVEWEDFDYERGPGKDGVERNACYIRHLILLSDPPTMFSENCTRLLSLNVGIRMWTIDSYSRIMLIVQNNPGIKSITMTDSKGPEHMVASYERRMMPFRDCLKAILSCSELKAMSITRYGLDSISMGFIFEIAARLECLTLQGSGYTGESLERWPCFPSLMKLKLGMEAPGQFQIGFIRRCPQLKVLNWYCTESNPVPITDVVDTFKIYCPLIEELALAHCFWSDQHISWILDNCGQLTSFTLSTGTITSLNRTSESLARHFSSLQELDVYNLTSKVIQNIMTSCPTLRSLRGAKLEASDILGETTDQATSMQPQPRDWICIKLQRLEFFICGLGDKPLEWNRTVLEGLSRLTKLEVLSVGDPSGPMESRDGLDLRLEAGLGILESLKQLKELSFWGLWQEMDERDVTWMSDAWPKLELVEGRLHTDRDQRPRLSAILSRTGVFVPDSDNDLDDDLSDDPDDDIEANLAANLDGDFDDEVV
ncbi:hypothetical protein B0O80DRAFT_472576 [Mortierella sp. GBAus27b]|nr:hypothetical protein B0O80DRAFT_472576 [Mortierella sp. GBAus27b]